MSVECVLYGASNSDVELLLSEPESIHDFLGVPPPPWGWHGKPPKRGCLGLFMPRIVPPPQVHEHPEYQLGKPWEAIHFVLTGTRKDSDFPNGFLLSGGDWVGDVDVGYGPARVLQRTQVVEVAALLESISREEFAERSKVLENTPNVYGAPSFEDSRSLEYFLADYEGLRDFFSERASAGESVVIQYV